MNESVTPNEESVAGERSTTIADRVRSLQSRLGGILAMMLLAGIAVGLLAWYYLGAYQRHAAPASHSRVSAPRAPSEMALPALGKVPPSTLEQLFGPPPPLPPGAAPSWTRVRDADPPPRAIPPPTSTREKTPLERRLSGPVLSEVARSIATAVAALPDAASSGAAARVLATQRWLLPKGAFIDCTLETAIDSTLPGMATCVTATDTFGADGEVVLLERGTKLVGETRSFTQQGSARVYVLWSEARTPTGVIVPLDSPGTDELGRNGLPGHLERHFWARFGAALLISTLDSAVDAATRSSRGDTVILNPSRSTDVASEVLKSTADIRPTITKAQGDRIQVLVARDIDFRNVYELRSAAR